MSAIEKCAEMLRREAESMKACHTVGVGGEWYGESAKAEYDEMIAVAAAAIAERDELLEACETFAEWLGREESGFARAGNKRDTPEGERAWRDWYNENLRLCALAQERARAAIARATGDQP